MCELGPGLERNDFALNTFQTRTDFQLLHDCFPVRRALPRQNVRVQKILVVMQGVERGCGKFLRYFAGR